MTNKESLESALARVNGKLGINGKLYHDNTGWFVVWGNKSSLDSSARNAGELLAYLHGIEDVIDSLIRKL
jgi:hypothetical protein